MKAFITIILTLLINGSLQAQDLKFYRYDKDLLTKEFHRSRRAAFRSAMPEKSVAVFFANPIRNRSNDNDYDYHQDPNFYYLTGFTEPNAVVLIFKTPVNILGDTTDEILFVPNREPAAEQWTGRRAGVEGASAILGIGKVRLASEFEKLDVDFKSFDRLLYSLPRGVVDERLEKDDLFDLVEIGVEENFVAAVEYARQIYRSSHRPAVLRIAPRGDGSLLVEQRDPEAGRGTQLDERPGDRGDAGDPQQRSREIRFHVDLQRPAGVAGHHQLDDTIRAAALALTVLRETEQARLAIGEGVERLPNDDRLGARAADPALDGSIRVDDAVRAGPGRGRPGDGNDGGEGVGPAGRRELGGPVEQIPVRHNVSPPR
jgi:hypothetical protein